MAECKKLLSLIGRNTKYYFKDKVTFFLSLITPMILLVLFVTFLRNVYIDSFESAFPDGFTVDGRIIEGIAGAWLMSSVLSVSAVTVAFGSNIVMVNDKMDGNANDFAVSPVKSTTVSIGYFLSNFLVTTIVILTVMLVGHVYLAAVGWYLEIGDVFMIIVNVFINVLFGTLLAGVVESFISSSGGISAVVTLVSSLYGFIAGAYMPLSQFSDGLRNIICILPGTYGMGIMRNSYMGGYLNALSEAGVPAENLKGIADGFDSNLYVFGNNVPLWAMYLIILCTCAVLTAAFIAVVKVKSRRK